LKLPLALLFAAVVAPLVANAVAGEPDYEALRVAPNAVTPTSIVDEML
jgi:hypothetical protein